MLAELLDVLGAALDTTLTFFRDWWLLVAIVAFSMLAWPLPRVFSRVAEALERFASRPWRAAIAIGVLCLAWTGTVVAIRGGVQLPVIHDDIACELAAGMFAKGRIADPPHPLWQHFEQFHVLSVPARAAKYPIGQAVVMGSALWVTGRALLGETFVAALACMAVFWALRAALPGRWALLGAAATAVHPVMLNYALSWRGGGLAALGGALLFGATLRLVQKNGVRVGLIAGVGLVLLAMSRPFEGVVLAVGCAIGLLVHRRRGLVVPAAACFGVVVLGMIPVALHNRAVTGSYMRLPWSEYARQYDPAPHFIWQTAGPVPSYRNEEFRWVYERMYRRKWERVTAPGGLLPELHRKLYFMREMLYSDPELRLGAVLWPLFLIPLVMLPRALREEPAARIAVITGVVFLIAPLSTYANLLVHYLAPVTAVVVVLAFVLVRKLAEVPRGRWLAVAIAVALLWNVAGVTRWRPETRPHETLPPFAGPGKHLFLVDPGVYDVVYNGPDIDAQRVVWARDLGDNRALLAYYPDRRVWRVVDLRKGARQLRLVPVR